MVDCFRLIHLTQIHMPNMRVSAVLPVALCLIFASKTVSVHMPGVTIGSMGAFAGTSNTLSVAYLVPWTGGIGIGGRMASGFVIGIDAATSSGLLTGYQVEWIMQNTACMANMGITGLLFSWSTFKDLDMIMAGACSTVCQPAASLAGAWGLPIISWGCTAMALSDKEQYPTFTRSTGTYEQVAYAYDEFAEEMGWNTMCLLSSEDDIWRRVADKTQEVLELNNRVIHVFVFGVTQFGPNAYPEEIVRLRNTMTTLKDRCRVIFTLCFKEDFRQILLAADDLGMLNGDYAIIGTEIQDVITTFANNATLNDPANIYKGFINARMVYPETPALDGFKQGVIDAMQQQPFDPYDSIRLASDATKDQVDLHATRAYDAMLMYASAVSYVTTNGDSPDDGFAITDAILNHHPTGINSPVMGNFKINEFGDRITDFQIEMIHGNTTPTALHKWLTETQTLNREYDSGNVSDPWDGLIWFNDRLTVPADAPACGYLNEHCTPEAKGTSIVMIVAPVAVVVVLLIVCAVVAVHYVKKMNYENALKQIAQATIKWSEINTDTAAFGKSFLSVASAMSTGGGGGSREVFCDLGKMGDEKVALKKLGAAIIDMKNRDILVELKEMSSLKHENVNNFVGVCTETPNCCIVTTYGPKGSIQEVISDDNVTLTWDFKISMVSDIASGMRYLHGTSLGFHGNLSSSKCIVDGRWTVKINGYGLPIIRQIGKQHDDRTDYAKAMRKLWVAPEFLKPHEERGSKQADVYSYGIIVSEIITEDLPYSLNDPELEPEETAEEVAAEHEVPYRPHVPTDMCTELWREMMEASWAEEPDERPTFTKILAMIKEINGGKMINLVDNMINRLEAHTRVLEDRVAERSKELETEKAKVEVLLNELLPKSVAAALKSGEQFDPEAFDCISLFFSDIVGFTNISSKGTPMEVVVMLNNMYTCFDDVASNFDVYKVATIGDAYMVSSGCPERNGDRHADEITALSIALLDASASFPIPHIPGEHLRLRIGLHSGPVVAGVAGIKMPRYLLFGDTVDIGTKMESGGEAMKIHISQFTEQLLTKDKFDIEWRQKLEVKGAGLISTYWVHGYKNKDK